MYSFLCVLFPATCHSATAGVLWASFHSFFLINLIWLVGWTIASHSIAQIYSWKKIKRHRSRITSTSQKPWLQGQIFLQRSPFFPISFPLFLSWPRKEGRLLSFKKYQGCKELCSLNILWSLVTRAILRWMTVRCTF